MSQMGFFDADKRLSALSAKGDPLVGISALVPWETFRDDIETVVLTSEEARKSNAGRKPLDGLVLFRMLVLQSLYNLSDEQAEYQVRDRLSFTRFLGLGIEDGIPDGTTLWLFREKLAKAGLIDKLFERFGQHLEAKGYIARGGQMSDGEAEALFRVLRWPETNGAPVCPHCGGLDAYEARRPNGSPRFRCKACAKDFTLTSGTLFGSHKLPLRSYLGAIAIFVTTHPLRRCDSGVAG